MTPPTMACSCCSASSGSAMHADRERRKRTWGARCRGIAAPGPARANVAADVPDAPERNPRDPRRGVSFVLPPKLRNRDPSWGFETRCALEAAHDREAPAGTAGIDRTE